MPEDSKSCGDQSRAGFEPQVRWLSEGIEVLFERFAPGTEAPEFHCDVLIVGSGYGGAVAAEQLAGCVDQEDRQIDVWVFERGKEYLPGMFPSRMSELAGHVRFNTADSTQPRGERDGLFDVRVGADVSAVLANGLGGGSLINANVMELPRAGVFTEAPWPTAFSNCADLQRIARDLQVRLGAANAPGGNIQDNTIERRNPPEIPLKFTALRGLSQSPQQFRAVPITVAMDNIHTAAGVPMNKCNLCGDCATGCNHGSKISLDVSLLAAAWQKGAKLYTGATVLRIEQRRAGWCAFVTHTDDQLRRRQGDPVEIRCKKLMLAAGAYGSTEILLRSQTERLRFSPRLGHGFSSNGDMVAVIWGQQARVNAVADECDRAGARQVGPTITGLIDARSANGSHGHVIEEFAIPGTLRRLFEETFATANTLHDLTLCDQSKHTGAEQGIDPCAIDPAIVDRSQILGIICRDSADGRMELVGDARSDHGDGAIKVVWPQLRDDPRFQSAVDDAVRRHGEVPNATGRVIANPMWRLLPADLEFLFGGQKGPPLTVHPLGGCGMADSPQYGVVDDIGRVYNGAPSRLATTSQYRRHDGLVVLDGSIIPTSVGINPALTIATVAMRAAAHLRAHWGLSVHPVRIPLPPRGRFRMPQPSRPKPTRLEFVERMHGTAFFRDRLGRRHERVIELTLHFAQIDVRALISDWQRPHLQVDEHNSSLRIFRPEDWRDMRELPDRAAELVAPLSGCLNILHRRPTSAFRRRALALYAWFVNRGLRDTLIWLDDLIQGRLSPRQKGAGAWARAINALTLATRAGEVRLLEYDLAIGNARSAANHFQGMSGQRIRACKTLTYRRRCNPWRQLMELTLQDVPTDTGSGWSIAEHRQLTLDLPFLARQGIPLFRIVDQEDMPAALADLTSFVLFFLRLLLNIHVWSFRLPDKPAPRAPVRLPGPVDGLPEPEITRLRTDTIPDGTPVFIQLTRYPGVGLPVLMIHGYSASGTTFAHHAVRPNLAEFMHKNGLDVWIVDLRTSAGLATAREPWAFEDAAYSDIPAAVDFIVQTTGFQKIDIVAHCMGSAMLNMALLGAADSGDSFNRDPYRAERIALSDRIRRLVMSQVGPATYFSPANTLRAYLMRYLRYFLPLKDYQFRVDGEPSMTDQLLDRLLATMPYPAEEFDLENPFWPPGQRTPWVGTRHRMDALYGRDFSLKNIGPKVLEFIDDHFGPLNIDTVAQGINFARWHTITDWHGNNRFVRPARIHDVYHFPVLSIHGEENGLTHVETLGLLKELFADAHLSKNFQSYRVRGRGHQDCLIGRGRMEVFLEIWWFLHGWQT